MKLNLNFKKLLKNIYEKHGKIALTGFLIYFVTKWTLTFLYGPQIISFIKNLF